MARHLLLRLSSPLIAFGGETVDNLGVIRDFPALSMVTGLLANALGWDRAEDALHNRLQARLKLGSRLEVGGSRLTDFQTAQLGAGDRAWTTMGVPEERRGGAASYDSPHLRFRDYHADMTALLALRLDPVQETPNLDDLASALDRPKRPLFIGRKPCLPTCRLVDGWVEADNVLQALQLAPFQDSNRALLAQWPDSEGELAGDRVFDLCDERNWTSGVHGGWRPVREGLIRAVGTVA
jgi:CRISPR system Cascade subunit CasD